MKLNYGKTFLLGFGFFGVSVIWGVYNAFVPLFLANKFGLSPVWIGFFMTLDNIAALLIQPPVGAWSDRLRTPIGQAHAVHPDRRTAGCPGFWPDPAGQRAAAICRLHQHFAAQHGALAHTGDRPDARYHPLAVPLAGQWHDQFHGRELGRSSPFWSAPALTK